MHMSPRLGRALRLSVRWSLLSASLLTVLVLGVATQLYSGPLEIWVARDLNGVFYAMAWCFGMSLLRPTASPRRLTAAAVVLCFGIEASQLWHPHLLEVWRAQPLGRWVLGSSFAWQDLPYYALGGVIAGAWLSVLPFRLGAERLGPERMGRERTSPKRTHPERTDPERMNPAPRSKTKGEPSHVRPYGALG